MEKTPIKFTSKVKTRWFWTISVFVWAVLCYLMIFILGYGLITNPSRIPDLILIWIVLILAAIGSTNYLTWQLTGRENLIISDNCIELFNSGTLFKRRIKISFSETESFDSDEDKETLGWIKLWGIGGGKVKVEYLGRKRRFGQDLTLEQAREIADTLKTEFETRKTNANNT